MCKPSVPSVQYVDLINDARKNSDTNMLHSKGVNSQRDGLDGKLYKRQVLLMWLAAKQEVLQTKRFAEIIIWCAVAGKTVN
jgi:hypothetical protein